MSIIRCKVCGKISAITLYRRKDCGVLCSCQYKEIEKKAQKIVFDTIIANLYIEKNVATMDEIPSSLYSHGKTAAETIESIDKAIIAANKIAAENDGCKVIEVENEQDALKKASLFGVPITHEHCISAFAIKEDKDA